MSILLQSDPVQAGQGHEEKSALVAGVSVFLLASVVRLIFWLSTHWTIEDALIIGRMVRNAVEYGELSFNLGQNISSSTSLIFALLVTGISYAGVDPIVAAKLVGLVSSSTTCVLLFFLFRRHFPVSVSFGASMIYATLPPVVAYSVGGMETALYTFACCAALERWIHKAELQSALFAALAAWARPDGIIILGVVFAAIAVDNKFRLMPIIRVLWPSFVLLGFGHVIHLVVYGSTVPHSAIAKQVAYPMLDPMANVVRYLDRMLFAQPGSVVIYLLAFIGVVWVWYNARRWFIALAWYILYHLAFMLRAPLFDWYLQPPLVVLCAFAAAGILLTIQETTRRIPRLAKHTTKSQLTATIGLSVLLTTALVPYGLNRKHAQMYQERILGGAGRWLAQNAEPDALAFSEALGYIGYSSVQPFVDWPGLATPGAPELLQARGAQFSRWKGFLAIIQTYKPSHLVLRRNEWQRLRSDLESEYTLTATFPTPDPNLGPDYFIAVRRTVIPR